MSNLQKQLVALEVQKGRVLRYLSNVWKAGRRKSSNHCCSIQDIYHGSLDCMPRQSYFQSLLITKNLKAMDTFSGKRFGKIIIILGKILYINKFYHPALFSIIAISSPFLALSSSFKSFLMVQWHYKDSIL